MAKCSVDGCTELHRARGYCNLHWMRWRFNIPLNLPKYYNRIAKKGWTHAGYRWLSTPDRGEIMQHRYFMEKHIGRLLDTDEIVHHKNGDKLDNRLENLEIMPRDKHTSHHRAHRIHCVVCRKDDSHGAFGLCSNHYQMAMNFVKRFKLDLPKSRFARLHTLIGLAWTISNGHVQNSIQQVLSHDDAA